MSKKEFTGVNITLPTCRLAYPNVFEMKYNELKDKEEYAVTMLFDKGANLNKLKQAMVTAAKNEFGLDVDLNSLDLKRIQDGDEKDHEYMKGQWVVKAATRLKAPGVVDVKLNKILDPTEIYSGVYANVNVTVKAYGKPTRGVTLYLNHIQKVKDGEQLTGGPKVTDVFEELEIEENEAVENVDDMEAMFG